MNDRAIRKWLSLCKAARKLPRNQWDLWTFMVGTGGTLEDRTRLGAAALSTFGRSWTYETITWNDQPGGHDE